MALPYNSACRISAAAAHGWGPQTLEMSRAIMKSGATVRNTLCEKNDFT